MAEARVTAAGAYIEEDPANEGRVTAVGAYIEEDPANEAKITSVGAYVEQGPIDKAMVTAIGAYIEVGQSENLIDSNLLLLVRYNGVYLAARVIIPPEYRGANISQPVQFGRSTTGKGLRVTAPVVKKEWAGVILLEKNPDGYTMYAAQRYELATDLEIRTALRERALEVRGFEDDSFWYAAWVERRWSPDLAYEPVATHRQKVLHLVER